MKTGQRSLERQDKSFSPSSLGAGRLDHEIQHGGCYRSICGGGRTTQGTDRFENGVLGIFFFFNRIIYFLFSREVFRDVQNDSDDRVEKGYLYLEGERVQS